MPTLIADIDKTACKYSSALMDQLMDGQSWEVSLQEIEDLNATISAFYMALRRAAVKRGVRVVVNVIPGKCVRLRAWKEEETD
jgi:hypothetical protein